jgi:radical SAM superfamily enzyme YgiQ (UPF0313 family)
VEREKPHVVGISACATPSIYDVYRIARIVKGIDPGIPVVVGGGHATFTAKKTLEECPHIDVVVRGEGEETFKELCNAIGEGRSLGDMAGVSYRAGDGVKENPDREPIRDLDGIPYPAYHLLPMHLYRMGRRPFASIITSRGCPYRCIFCSSSQLFGKRWRARSPENVIGELKLLRDRYRVSEIEFLDDIFTLDPRRVKRICDLMVEEGLDITWTCSSRVDTISRFPEMAEYLRGAGCHTVYIGIESGSQRILDLVNKGITLRQVEKAVEVLRRAKLRVLGSFILGVPGEGREDLERTVWFSKTLNLDLVQFTICTPYPGTPLYEEASEKGWLLTGDWRRYDVLTPVMELPDLSPRDLSKILHRAYISYYGRPSFLWRLVRDRNFTLIRKIAKAVIDYIGSL